MTIQKLKPSDIRTNCGTQARKAMSQAAIDRYAVDMLNGDTFPNLYSRAIHCWNADRKAVSYNGAYRATDPLPVAMTLAA